MCCTAAEFFAIASLSKLTANSSQFQLRSQGTGSPVPFYFGGHMDLRQFYKKMREVESSLQQPYVMVTSVETSEGGKPGVVSEVTREVAAMLIVSGRAVVANEGEIESYRASQVEARQALETAELAKRLQVAIITDPEGKLAGRKPATK
jgi:hypothetical protein